MGTHCIKKPYIARRSILTGRWRPEGCQRLLPLAQGAAGRQAWNYGYLGGDAMAVLPICYGVREIPAVWYLFCRVKGLETCLSQSNRVPIVASVDYPLSTGQTNRPMALQSVDNAVPENPDLARLT